MRRVLALLVLALVGAGLYGFAGSSGAVTVNAQQISRSELHAELTALRATPTLQCYLSALAGAALEGGAGSDTMTSAGVTAWTNLRIEGLAIDEYAKSYLHFAPTTAVLATAQSSLVGEMTQAAAQDSLTCPGTAEQALADMPTAMRTAEVEDQAASVYLLGKLNTTIPVNVASLKAYYQAHVASYDTICVAVAVVTPANVPAFEAAARKGEGVAQLAKAYSIDASKSKGGAYGCFAPGSTSFSTVRTDTATTPLHHFQSAPSYITYNGGTDALFIAPTSRTVTPFATAGSLVLTDVQTHNASSASTVREKILYYADITVDLSLGRWGLASSGPALFAPAVPLNAGVDKGTMLSTVSASTYQ